MLAELIPSAFESGSINQCDPDINPDNFPGDLVRGGLRLVTLQDLKLTPDKALFQTRRGGLFQRDAILVAMFASRVAAANMAELVTYAKDHPDWHESRFIVALGQTWTNPRNVQEEAKGWHDIRIPTIFCGSLFFWGRSGHLELGLADADQLWSNNSKYLVVPAYKGEK